MLVIIFSRDRAMQLDAVLQSLFLHCQDIDRADIWILYKTTNILHEKQYQELLEAYSGRVFFKQQQNFRKDLLSLLAPFKKKNFRGIIFGWLSSLGNFGPPLGSQSNRVWRRMVTPLLSFFSTMLIGPAASDDYVLFLVDDNLFIRDFSFKHAIDLLKHIEKLLGFSLRLGRNTKYCYAARREQFLPDFEDTGNGMVLFNWTCSDGDFGYPLEVSSSIYRLRDILPMLAGISFGNPNSLEDRMAFSARSFKKKRPLLASFQQSVTFCNPVNLVQSVMENRSGESIRYSADELSSRFERGERIQVEAYSGFVPEACHQEVELIFEMSRSRQYGS